MTDATNPGLNFPVRLNGYMVMACRWTPPASATRAGYVVLVDRGEDREFHRYVTAWTGEGDEGWTSGHYISDRAEAEADFAHRSKRGY